MTDLATLKEQIKKTAKAREETRRLAGEKEQAYRLWAEANQALLNAVDDAKVYQADQESKLRQLTLEAYEETGEKKPAEGVGIREVTHLDYDPKEALQWAIKHVMCLQLDRKAFEKVAQIDPPEFVSITKAAQATIAQELKVE